MIVSTYITRKKGTLRNIVVIISYNTEKKTTANKTLNIDYRKQITVTKKKDTNKNKLTHINKYIHMYIGLFNVYRFDTSQSLCQSVK